MRGDRQKQADKSVKQPELLMCAAWKTQPEEVMDPDRGLGLGLGSVIGPL